MPQFRRLVLVGATLLAACGHAPPPTTAPVPTPAVAPAAPAPTVAVTPAAVAPALPPFPRASGALSLDMVYPPENHTLSVRDSTFVFGSVGHGDATLVINGAPVRVNPNGSFMAYLPVPSDTVYTMHAALPTGETAVAVRRLRYPPRNAAPRPAAVLDTVGYPRLVTLANTNEYAASDTDRVTIARPTPGGTYQWFLLPGTEVIATGRLGGSTRIRLDSQIEAWVENAGIVTATGSGAAGAAPDTTPSPAPPATVTPRIQRLTAARVAAAAGYTDIVLSLSARTPVAVEQSGTGMTLTVYGARANLDIIRFDTNDPTVRLVRHEQVSNDRVRFDVDLRHPPVGYLVLWRNSALVLRVRHLPPIHAASPLRGRVIAVDPGHPPGGSMGPTRLWEPEATLAIGEALKTMLEARGARVLMLRTSMDAVALGARPIQARRENAEAFVSIHLNAFADGANPFAAARGTGTFFFHPQSEPLARFVQQGMVRHLGLRDEGIFFNNLAVVRATWFPSVLCEGAWTVMPEQEAALRTPEFQRAYARGVVDGLEQYFRSLAMPR
ncbi:MAG: N-acetylmuramoyl-L-alanine amidase [Gemmatimonadota bacterium]|nr:N-acetylmuramoyl-L-alanine amidase [Gemmatimonadota bacterium]